jgi:hypothetical protein
MDTGETRNRWQLLDGGQLKWLGAAMMVCDHLHQMFFAHGVPEWFYWIGRPVAPLFAFLCAEGFYHTRAPGKYMLRLLAGFEFMNAASALIGRALVNQDVVLINNIFETFLLAAAYMWLIGQLRRAAAAGKYARAAMSLLAMPLIVAAGQGALALLSDPAVMVSTPIWLKIALLRAMPNIILTEGGFVFVLMTVLFYVFRDKRRLQALTLLSVSALSWFEFEGAQWLMGFAALFLALYNGRRGKTGKYFFYIFYPAHIYLFYALAWLLQ